MATTGIPASLDLGGGMTAAFLAVPGAAIPWGLVLRHGVHRIVVPWAERPGVEVPTWTLLSLDPVSLLEPVMCPLCGVCGRVRDGAWIAQPPPRVIRGAG